MTKTTTLRTKAYIGVIGVLLRVAGVSLGDKVRSLLIPDRLGVEPLLLVDMVGASMRRSWHV